LLFSAVNEMALSLHVCLLLAGHFTLGDIANVCCKYSMFWC